MLNRRLRMWFQLNWIKFTIITVLFLLIFLLVWGLSRIESFYRQMQLVQIPMYILMGVINASVFVFMWLFFLRGMTKIAAGRVRAKDVNVRWDDVIGIDEAKEEAWEVVQLINDRTRVQKIGGKILRGLLMVGPPGCGKTYLAKAIATEAGVPFLPMAASEFTEIFVGVGASKIRKLFKRARIFAQGYGCCIIFIDELDAIGRTRSFSFMGGGQETNTTQNQLLVEMDGLKDKAENVIVIGATNAAEGILDPALLRPGRFDRKVYIDIPGVEGRQKIFEYYLKKIKCAPDMNILRLARKAVFKSPADIENIIKEAALIATRNKKDCVSMGEISEAMERIDMGVKRRRKMTDREREMIAYHESGHLLTLYRLHPTEDVFKASIISRKETLGAVHHSPREEEFTRGQDSYMADIKVALGGYCAEKQRYGATSSGVSSDFKKAMAVAHNMVWKLGMGSSGLVGDYTIIPKEQLSEKVRDKLNVDTSKILNDCIKETEELLTKEKHILERFVKELLKKEELDYDDVKAIFDEYKIGKKSNKN